MSPQDGGDGQRAVLVSPPRFTGEGLMEELATSENIWCEKEVCKSVNPVGDLGILVLMWKKPSCEFYCLDKDHSA